MAQRSIFMNPKQLSIPQDEEQGVVGEEAEEVGLGHTWRTIWSNSFGAGLHVPRLNELRTRHV